MFLHITIDLKLYLECLFCLWILIAYYKSWYIGIIITLFYCDTDGWCYFWHLQIIFLKSSDRNLLSMCSFGFILLLVPRTADELLKLYLWIHKINSKQIVEMKEFIFNFTANTNSMFWEKRNIFFLYFHSVSFFWSAKSICTFLKKIWRSV